jgi:beta-phosphoglucomutase-like phosphatase (HAD superfamily)
MVATEDETNMMSNTGAISHSTKTEQDLVRCMELLKEHSIQLVVFDMDQTAVAAHSRGRLERSEPEFSTFLNHATPDFLSLIPRLFAANISMAIATHSDAAEYGVIDVEVQLETHVLGEDWARNSPAPW